MENGKMPKSSELDYVKALREWRKENPKTDFALGFIPGIGTALAADDFIQDPSLLNAAALVPWGKAWKMAKGLRSPTLGIQGGKRAYHASHAPIEKLEHKPSEMFQGEGMATEGPGFYLTRHPGRSITYMGQGATKNPQRNAYLHQYKIPEEDWARFARPTELEFTHPDTLRALKQMYPGKSVEEMQDIIRKSDTPDSLLGLAGIDPHGKIDRQQYIDLLEEYRGRGIPGVATGPSDFNYVVSHFPERLKPLGKPKKIPLDSEKQADWLMEYDLHWDDGLIPRREDMAHMLKKYRKLRKDRSDEFPGYTSNPDDRLGLFQDFYD
jgi:hypothetical protein